MRGTTAAAGRVGDSRVGCAPIRAVGDARRGGSSAVVAAVLTFLWVRASGAHSSTLDPPATAGSVLAAPPRPSPVEAGSACAAPGSVVVDVAGKVAGRGCTTCRPAPGSTTRSAPPAERGRESTSPASTSPRT